MEQFEREMVEQYFEKGFGEFRYSIACMFNGEYLCDIATFESPDVAQICIDALREHFTKAYPGTNFILDNRKATHDLAELLEVISTNDE